MSRVKTGLPKLFAAKWIVYQSTSHFNDVGFARSDDLYAEIRIDNGTDHCNRNINMFFNCVASVIVGRKTGNYQTMQLTAVTF